MNNEEYSHVQERIRDMKALQRKKYDITFENVAGKLATIRDAAATDGSYGPAVNAEIARAKLGGLMVDRKEVRFGKIDSMSREELENRLKQLMEENQIRSIDGEARIIEDEDDDTKIKDYLEESNAQGILIDPEQLLELICEWETEED